MIKKKKCKSTSWLFLISEIKMKKEKLVSLQKTCVVLWMYVNTPESSA